MPVVTGKNPNMTQMGLVIPVYLSLSTPIRELLKSKKEVIPNPVSLMALVDTGATRTVIQKGICRTLNLTPRNRVQMLTAGVPCIAEEFDVSLMFPMLNISFDPIFVLEAPLTGQNISCLIGRDLL